MMSYWNIFPSGCTVITVNGVPLIQAPSNIGLEKEDEESQTKYVYDVYWYEEEESEDLVQEQEYREAREQDYSSNDEEHPDNDYPDEDSGSDYNHYGDNDDTRDMLEEFEAHRIRDSDDESESDSLPDWAEDLSWSDPRATNTYDVIHLYIRYLYFDNNTYHGFDFKLQVSLSVCRNPSVGCIRVKSDGLRIHRVSHSNPAVISTSEQKGGK